MTASEVAVTSTPPGVVAGSTSPAARSAQGNVTVGSSTRTTSKVTRHRADGRSSPSGPSASRCSLSGPSLSGVWSRARQRKPRPASRAARCSSRARPMALNAARCSPLVVDTARSPRRADVTRRATTTSARVERPRSGRQPPVSNAHRAALSARCSTTDRAAPGGAPPAKGAHSASGAWLPSEAMARSSSTLWRSRHRASQRVSAGPVRPSPSDRPPRRTVGASNPARAAYTPRSAAAYTHRSEAEVSSTA